MTLARRHHAYTYADYLAHEVGSSSRHEFLDGEIYLMAGGSIEHAALGAAVITALGAQLRGRGCTVFSSDLKVRVAATGLVTYPDVTVICGAVETDPASAHVALNPTLLVEVTSPGTEGWDRGEKLESYVQIPSLQEILLVAHQRRHLELRSRTPGGSWTLSQATGGGTLTLASVGATLSVDDLYAGLAIGG